jgi:hypothetical protein
MYIRGRLVVIFRAIFRGEPRDLSKRHAAFCVFMEAHLMRGEYKKIEATDARRALNLKIKSGGGGGAVAARGSFMAGPNSLA